MEVKRLQLKQFRNYASLDLEFCSGVNLISGKNGQGKTSILEAIFLCTCARSHRTSKDKELIQHGASSYTVEMELESAYRTEKLSESLLIHYEEKSFLNKKATRQVFKDGVKLDRVAELMGIFNAVIFAPEDIQLIKASPQGRRRFVDLLLSQVKRSYFVQLTQYHQVLQQRNHLLKQMKEHSGNRNLLHLQLEVWNERFLDFATDLFWERKTLLKDLANSLKPYHANISGGKEEVKLIYESHRAVLDGESKEEIRLGLEERLKKMELQEIERGISLTGPQRDDLDFLLNGVSLKTYGSQGQQRTCVLALKQAELDFLKAKTKQTPVLLLDDVLPELDEQRRLSLISGIQETQVFITCTDVEEAHVQLRSMLHDRGSRSFVVRDGEAFTQQEASK